MSSRMSDTRPHAYGVSETTLNHRSSIANLYAASLCHLSDTFLMEKEELTVSDGVDVPGEDKEAACEAMEVVQLQMNTS